MTETQAVFDLGVRIDTGENSRYHGSGWLNPDGTVKLCIGPNTSYMMHNDGTTTVWYNGRKAW
jgi:hypothetical protein